MTRLAWALLLIGAGLLRLDAQTPGTGTGPVLFEGARLIAGDGRPAVENSAFLVEGSRITQVGTRGSVRRPSGATVVDLEGKTVIPALIDAHSHLGYTDVRTGETLWQARLGTSVQGYPVAFSVGGREYIAVTTGLGGGSPRQVPRTISPDVRHPLNGNAIYVFALPERGR